MPATKTRPRTKRNATFPYVRRLARNGWREACRKDSALRGGLNIVEGKITHPGVAEAFGLDYSIPDLDSHQ